MVDIGSLAELKCQGQRHRRKREKNGNSGHGGQWQLKKAPSNMAPQAELPSRETMKKTQWIAVKPK